MQAGTPKHWNLSEHKPFRALSQGLRAIRGTAHSLFPGVAFRQ
jgi:hypothetical protein